MKAKPFLIGLLLVAIVGLTLYSGNVVQAFDHVFSVQVEGDVVRSRGRFRTRGEVTRFRTRGITRRGSDFGSCASSSYGSCDSSYSYSR